MTTNGTLLPFMAKPLREAGVQRLNISLDTLDEKKYAYITRWGRLSDAMNGIQSALDAGFEKIKINTVLLGGVNDDEIPAFAELSRKYPLDVRFIELMPMYDSGDFTAAAMLPCSAVLSRLPELHPYEQDHGVARLYRFPDGKGRIGLISPVSQHFCGACNRIRLTADGKLKPCLHSSDEYAIKGLDQEGMRRQMQNSILGKPAAHLPLSAEERSGAGRNMNRIGG